MTWRNGFASALFIILALVTLLAVALASSRRGLRKKKEVRKHATGRVRGPAHRLERMPVRLPARQ